MIETRQLRFNSALAMIKGLKELYEEGLRPREVMFVAFDSHGDVHLEIPVHMHDVQRLKVGNKFTLSWPFEGPMFYLDAVHRLPDKAVLINGDRRIGRFSSLIDVASLVSWFVNEAQDNSIFFGCTPHQPGSWFVRGEESIALHQRGYVDIVHTEVGLLARRIMDPGLFFLPMDKAAAGQVDGFERIYNSPLGNVLMLERRLLYDQLVLSCQDGLVEVDLYELPRVHESGRFSIRGGFSVAGRISGGAFAVSRGVPMDWGLDKLQPAVLVGSDGCSFLELRKLLRELRDGPLFPKPRPEAQ
jgi:hypothetical protein